MKTENFIKKFKNIDLPLHGVRLPSFEPSQSLRDRLGAEKDEDNASILKKLCNEGYKTKVEAKEIDPSKAKEYADRAKHELEMSFT